MRKRRGASTVRLGGFAQQLRVLTARYAQVLLGDLSTLLILLLQAPLIGWLCSLVWGEMERETPALYFVLVLSAIWFGAINACREVVKERAIYQREALLGVRPSAYILSKLLLLGLLGLAQALLLQIALEWRLALAGPFLLQSLILFSASLSGVGLGLCVSTLATRQERAVAAIPLLLLPQILFSEFVVPAEAQGDLVAFGEKLMPLYWGYEAFAESAALEVDWGYLFAALSALTLGGVALALLPILLLPLTARAPL